MTQIIAWITKNIKAERLPRVVCWLCGSYNVDGFSIENQCRSKERAEGYVGICDNCIKVLARAVAKAEEVGEFRVKEVLEDPIMGRADKKTSYD